MMHTGDKTTTDVWLVEGKANHGTLDVDWVITLAELPPTIKGRHQGEKICSKFMDEAHKRLKQR